MTLPVMIFAAGFGTRMGALTRDRPKPLVEVAGRALIDHALDLVAGYAPPRTVVNLHYRAGQLAAHLSGRGVALSHETPYILDTGGGLRAALPLLGDGPVLTMNSDAVWRGPNPLSHLDALWDGTAMGALLLCLPPDRALGHAGPGDFSLAADGRLARGPGLVYSGVQVIDPACLADIPDRAFSLNRACDALAADGRLFGTVYPGHWCDVGHPGGIAQAEHMLEAGHVRD
jgi:MurNAc alpha-1-phosphate uridylyltransferase